MGSDGSKPAGHVHHGRPVSSVSGAGSIQRRSSPSRSILRDRPIDPPVIGRPREPVPTVEDLSRPVARLCSRSPSDSERERDHSWDSYRRRYSKTGQDDGGAAKTKKDEFGSSNQRSNMVSTGHEPRAADTSAEWRGSIIRGAIFRPSNPVQRAPSKSPPRSRSRSRSPSAEQRRAGHVDDEKREKCDRPLPKSTGEAPAGMWNKPAGQMGPPPPEYDQMMEKLISRFVELEKKKGDVNDSEPTPPKSNLVDPASVLNAKFKVAVSKLPETMKTNQSGGEVEKERQSMQTSNIGKTEKTGSRKTSAVPPPSQIDTAVQTDQTDEELVLNLLLAMPVMISKLEIIMK